LDLQLREMKGCLDRSPPKECPHLKRRAKQEQVKPVQCCMIRAVAIN